MGSYQIQLRIYFEDTDAGGIVYYVNYLKFMERARTEYLRSLGFEQQQLFAQNIMFVVHSLNAQYHHPARLDDLLTVGLEVIKGARSYLVFKQRIVDSKNATLLCEADVKVACLKVDTMKPCAIPSTMRESMVSGCSRSGSQNQNR